ncbi:hypothetical protein HBI56_070280 [Parastagonospora nodorum]|uniref:Aminoglycoside phosphotransferase domain-containing protein n=2 Tax=Phaeosphaeria nodorum (strain SN15 / ATCC MYA-4574 / FGSC 10173) TaxID=321614 RepID=A0A7U2EQZ5_PHANO|nr:hypothetical protein SNOG_09764 [Parastagonospora nodorum SN15]KAH3920454.1 hypothetical protein HBH56_004720 [Parastagonospora nodorum]EAT83029.1 hypothetical protein SNOG_09764 [Parastagonospora nodorum SN15]KAH3937879.1 hypothetical protein HBH54_004710 [Parastagonospora nodorum]KAH3946580.1 hypothetical protein HBH53_127260 [Parastagonospora nodorum]KAH3974910.1 hypothetical protein HBH51_087460 [Parastagonospora nodorum]
MYDGVAKDSLHQANMGNHGVCRLGDAVVKCNFDPIILEEAETLLFLAEKRPELRIPTVLAIWSATKENGDIVYCFMMNLIEGIPLSHNKFAELSIYAQDTICAKVSSQLRYLRDLPSEGYYGRPYRKGWIRATPSLDTNTSGFLAVTGPYETYEEFCAAIYRARQLKDAMSNSLPEWHPTDAELTARFISTLSGWAPNEPKFTWIDPQITNIIARQVTADDGSEDWEVFLIDWEGTGWYPAWLQGVQLSVRGGIALVHGGGDYSIHRGREPVDMMLKDFDPKPDEERLAAIRNDYWRFY